MFGVLKKIFAFAGKRKKTVSKINDCSFCWSCFLCLASSSHDVFSRLYCSRANIKNMVRIVNYACFYYWQGSLLLLLHECTNGNRIFYGS